MSGAPRRWAALEEAAATDLGRGSAVLAGALAGDLERAVRSLAGHAAPRLVVLTGFAIPDGAGGWDAETDGPLGAVQLALTARALGWDVRVLTDEPCAAPLAAVLPPDVPLDVARIGEPHDCPDLVDRYRAAGTTHLVSIERVGPSADGVPRNMRGEAIGAATACLEHVVTAGDWQVVAVGDGGNEIGMGRAPADLVHRVVPRGATVRCVVGADALVVGGTSNWGAAALVAGLALGTGRADLLGVLAAGTGADLLRRLVAAGAVDGVTRLPAETVDGLGWAEYQGVVDTIAAIAAESGEQP